MKILTLKFKIIIGVILFIVLIGAGYSATMLKTPITTNTLQTQIGEKVYNGTFLTPVENFITVTSRYGVRIHPITRKTK